MRTVWQDLSFGLRVLRKSPGFTAVAILTLALGIGASTAVFSLVDAVMLRAAPFKDADRLVLVWAPDPHLLASVGSVLGTHPEMAFEVFNPTAGDFYDFQSQNHSFTAMAMFKSKQFNLTYGGVALRVQAAVVSGDFFSLLGAAPELGRPITDAEDRPGQGNVAIISHAFWRDHLNADPHILGKALLLNFKPYQVIGVMPPRFDFPHSRDANDLGLSQQNLPPAIWIPFAYTAKDRADYEGDADSGVALARLRPGITIAEAQSEMNSILNGNRMRHPPDTRAFYALVTPLAGTMNAEPRKPLFLLLAAVSLVLLIACNNVAGLLMARAAGRVHEIGVRAALGARRLRLVRQLLTESLLLALGAGALGAAVAYAAVRAIIRLNSGTIPRMGAASVDSTALLFTLTVSLLTVVFFALLPALSASRANLGEILALSDGRSVKGSRLHQSLILAEIGLCVVLLAISGLFIRSLLNVNQVDKGFEPQAVLKARIVLDDRYDGDKPMRFFRELLRHTGPLPGIRAVAVTTGAPLSGYESVSLNFQIEGHPFDKHALFETREVTPDYFSVLRVPLLAGRYFTENDGPGKPPVAIISSSFACEYFPNGGAVGKHIYPVTDEGSPRSGEPTTIVGVVANVRAMFLEQTPVLQYYSPLWQSSGQSQADVLLSTVLPPATLAPQIRDIVRSIDPAVPIVDVRTMTDLVTSATAARRLQTLLLVSFAAVALFLSLVGLYALMAYSVRQRTAEIGIRMALGAKRLDVLNLVLRQAAKLAVAGATLGLAGSFAAARLIQRFLFGVKPLDPLTLAAAVAILICLSLLACWIPAHRAARIDPIEALRHE